MNENCSDKNSPLSEGWQNFKKILTGWFKMIRNFKFLTLLLEKAITETLSFAINHPVRNSENFRHPSRGGEFPYFL